MEDLLLSYAGDLNDDYPGHEFSIWSRTKLLEYFNEALGIIAAQRPDLFAELKVVKVEHCSSYLDLCDCSRVLEVLGQCTKDGKIIKRLTRRTHTANSWTGRVRTADAFVTELTEYEVLKDSNLVQVFPENLDPTKDLYVLVRCAVDAKTYTMDSEPPAKSCAFLAAARHFVIYSAKMKDAEFSPSMREAAKDHREMFTGILTMVNTADDKYNERRQTKPD